MCKPLNKRQKTIRDATYKRVGVGYTGDRSSNGYYVSVDEVEHRLTNKVGWITTICKGGGWCDIERYETTKVFEHERDAITAGDSLLRGRGGETNAR